MRSRPKAAITTTVRSRPEPASSAGTRFRRKAIRIEGDGEAMGTKGTARKPVGTAAPSRARFADWAKSHADQHQGQRDIRFPAPTDPMIGGRRIDCAILNRRILDHVTVVQ